MQPHTGRTGVKASKVEDLDQVTAILTPPSIDQSPDAPQLSPKDPTALSLYLALCFTSQLMVCFSLCIYTSLFPTNISIPCNPTSLHIPPLKPESWVSLKPLFHILHLSQEGFLYHIFSAPCCLIQSTLTLILTVAIRLGFIISTISFHQEDTLSFFDIPNTTLQSFNAGTGYAIVYLIISSLQLLVSFITSLSGFPL